MNKTLLILAIALTGCCAQMYKPSDMTPEQLKAMASDNKGVGYCLTAQNATAQNATGNVRGTFANLDLVNKISGSVVIDHDCKMTITGSSTATPTVAAASK